MATDADKREPTTGDAAPISSRTGPRPRAHATATRFARAAGMRIGSTVSTGANDGGPDERDDPRRRSVRVDGSARDRGDRRRVQEASRHPRARDPDARTSSPSSSPTSLPRSATRPRRRGTRSPSPSTARRSPSCSPARRASPSMIDNQFRPTPSSKLLPAVFDAIDAAGITDVRVCCANGKVFPMSESDMEQKLGRENLARMERNGWAFRQNDPQNPDAYTFVGVSSGGTPVWLLNEVASAELEDHDRPGAGEPLGRRRRRQADPARASSPTRPSSRTTARSSPRRRRTTARTSGRCARTSTRSRRCAGSTAR